jgi:hypothetical protein
VVPPAPSIFLAPFSSSRPPQKPKTVKFLPPSSSSYHPTLLLHIPPAPSIFFLAPFFLNRNKSLKTDFLSFFFFFFFFFLKSHWILTQELETSTEEKAIALELAAMKKQGCEEQPAAPTLQCRELRICGNPES